VKPAPFAYHRAHSVDEAVSLLAELGDEARLLAGGQSLVPLLNARLARPTAVIDVNRIAGLDGIVKEDGRLRVGALVRHAQLEWSPEITDALPLLGEMVRFVGDRQVRLRGTLGGSLAHADPTAELPLAAVTLGATVVAHGPGGGREIAAEELVQGYYTTSLAPDEMITEIAFPVGADHVGAFAEVARRHGDFAVLAVAATGVVGDDGAWRSLRIGLAGVGNRPVLCVEAAALGIGSRLDAETRRAIGEACLDVAEPKSDVRASAEYRRHLVRVYVSRVLETLERRREERVR
jgi:aerobic carbon-monoxide dehydrogenase medium subunit